MKSKYEFHKLVKEDTYWKIRDFLRQVWRRTSDKTLNWNVARLDYNRWHVFKNCYELDLLDYIYICEHENKIIAVFISDCKNGYHLQVDPEYYCDEVFEILFVEFKKAIDNAEVWMKLHIPAPEGDVVFEEALSNAGFKPTQWEEVRREFVLEGNITPAKLFPGSKIRSLGSEEELPARSWASWRAFHPNEPDENYEGWEWYKNLQLCPLYHRDLDLVSIAEDDSIVGFITAWFDDFNRTAYIDPVGVTPEHWRKGIGRALVSECLLRVQNLGAKRAYIESYDVPAHALYESVGLKAVKTLRTWKSGK